MLTTVSCEVCRHDLEHGWFGLKSGTHCRGCHRTWTGLKEAHCTACHELFGSVSTSDLHDPGMVCKPPGNLRRIDGTPALRPRQRASGIVWVSNSDTADWFEAANA